MGAFASGQKYSRKAPDMMSQKIVFSEIVRTALLNTGVQFPAFRVPPGARAFVRPLPFNVANVFVAEHTAPSLSTNAIALGIANERLIEIDVSMGSLSQWFFAVTNAGDGVQILVYLNKEEFAQ